jgi:hypothetical protein
VLTAVAVAAAAGWLYFRRFELMRPPIGVYDVHDVVFMLAAIVVLPFAYLALPRAVVGVVFCLVALNILYFGWEPVLRLRRWIWLAAVGCVSADVAASLASGAGSRVVLVVNDLELVALAVVVANVLAQSGMRARDLTLLAGALAVYDVIATTQVSLMSDLIRRLATLPFAPLVAWRDGGGWVALGLGDLLVVVLAPLVLRKAFGRTAGLVAAAASLVAVAAMLALVRWNLVRADIPAMVALGPLVLVQYAWWRTRRGGERRTWEYLEAEPATGRVTRELVDATRDRAAGRPARVGTGEIGRPTATAAIERR